MNLRNLLFHVFLFRNTVNRTHPSFAWQVFGCERRVDWGERLTESLTQSLAVSLVSILRAPVGATLIFQVSVTDNCLNCSDKSEYCFSLSSIDRTSNIFISFIESFYNNTVYHAQYRFNYSHEPNELTCSQTVWLHSSVGRASHRNRRGHRLESRWSHPNFSVVKKRQLLKLSR